MNREERLILQNQKAILFALINKDEEAEEELLKQHSKTCLALEEWIVD
jgi:hypothetical protein